MLATFLATPSTLAEEACQPVARIGLDGLVMPLADFMRVGEPIPVRLTSVWSSTYPSGENDGLLWSGRGVSQLLSAGAALSYGPLSAAVAPEVTWSENRAFDLVSNGRAGELRFGNPYYGNDNIDLPQRHEISRGRTLELLRGTATSDELPPEDRVPVESMRAQFELD